MVLVQELDWEDEQCMSGDGLVAARTGPSEVKNGSVKMGEKVDRCGRKEWALA